MTTKRYFLLRCFPEPGSVVPIMAHGHVNPAIIRELVGCPIGISGYELSKAVPDTLERAVVMARGIIGEYETFVVAGSTCSYLKRAWRVKAPCGYGLVRGHQLRIP